MPIVGEFVILGLSLASLVLFATALAGIITYIVSIQRDWRPMRSLRQENKDLRARLEEVEQQRAADKLKSDARITDLEAEVARLKRVTDVSTIHAKQEAMTELLGALVAEVKLLDRSIHANTAAVETLSKRRIIDEALSDH